jgi:hypothetical protein
MNPIKFALAVMLVFGLTAVANSALAGHTNGVPVTLTTIEYNVQGEGYLHPVYGPREFGTVDECMLFGSALGEYIVETQPDWRGVVLCLSPNGFQTWKEFLAETIEFYSQFFPPLYSQSGTV